MQAMAEAVHQWAAQEGPDTWVRHTHIVQMEMTHVDTRCTQSVWDLGDTLLIVNCTHAHAVR